jgi:hypothetical protein
MGMVDELATRASERTHLDDFGDPSWREGLSLLVASLEQEGILEAGRAFQYEKYEDALVNRLRVVDYLARHPEIRDEAIERPLVILGMPRTGTTVASYLLDQDPARRSLLNWEAENSVPPPTTATLRTDPRCLAKKAQLEEFAAQLAAAGQGMPHWEDADGPTECMFVQNQDFKALLWDAAMPDPTYYRWLLHTDVTSTYEYERLVLQLLQSRAPGTWSLKMPSHAVYIETLLTVFPDARIVWTHRDPFRATASLCSVWVGAKQMVLGDALDVGDLGEYATEQMREHVERPLRARSRIGADRFFDLHYADLMRDPIGQMESLYEWAGDEFTPELTGRMRTWLDTNPQDRFGPRPYSFEQFGLDRAELDRTFDEYLSTFDIELEWAAP